MPELVADFVRNGGTYMVLTGKAGLRSEQINRIQHAMLSSVSVPNLLRVDVREVDFNVSLHYEITGRRMLSQCLKHEQIGMEEFYSLLLQVLAVLDDGKQYMLSADHFLLSADRIFVEDELSSGILHFTYVPILDKLSDEPLSKTLLALITGLMGSVTVIEGDGIQQLLRYCSDDLFSVPHMKKMLLNLLSGDRSTGETPRKHGDVTMGPHIPAKKEAMAPRVMPLSSPRVTIREYVPHQEPILEPVHSDINGGSETESERGTDERTASRIGMYALPGASLLTALAWKFIYLDHPSRMALTISLIVTVLAAAAVFFIRSGKLNFARSLSKCGGSLDSEVTAGEEERRFLEADWRWSEPESLHSIFEVKTDIGKDAPNRAVKENFDIGTLPNENPVAGSVSHFPQPTVLLGRNQEPENRFSSVNTYSLSRMSQEQGQPEIIPLHFGSFIIGRSEDIAQYVDRTTGVSRAHVEVMVRREGCSLKDLGSVNGTRLRGELIAPYKEYPLEPEESFLIAGSTYTLKLSGQALAPEKA